jgi:hypothetical protein
MSETTLGGKRGWAYFVLRVAIFVPLLYAIDRTPLDAFRLVAYFHLGPVSSWFLALAAIAILWWASGVVLAYLLLAAAGTWLLATAGVARLRHNRAGDGK